MSHTTDNDNWEPTEKQKAYWERMRLRSGAQTPRWKGESAGKTAKHKWLDKHYGQPKVCENPACKGKATWFDWCLKKGREYSHNREDYLRMCRSCHRAYDLTPKLKEKAIQNLWWKTGLPNPGPAILSDPKINFNASKTHCKRGHEFTLIKSANPSRKRFCKECRKIYEKARKHPLPKLNTI